MEDCKGNMIPERSSDPTIVGKFSIYEAIITQDNMPVDYEGNTGRWHGYGVRCSREEIDALQPHILRGWYAHFWKRNKIIAVYNDRQFELIENDMNTWREVLEHGKAQGIAENELNFATD